MDAEKVTNRKNMEKVAVVLLKAREIIPEEKNKVRKIEKKYNSKDKEKCLRMDKRFLKQIQKCQKEGTKVFREIKTKQKKKQPATTGSSLSSRLFLMVIIPWGQNGD